MMKVIISGAVANKPFNGGNAWTRLSWALDLKKLGLDVCFVEQIQTANCLDQVGRRTSFENSANLAYFRHVMERFGLGQSSSLVCTDNDKVHGLSISELKAWAQDASLLLNIS